MDPKTLSLEQKQELFRRTATDPVARAEFAASRAEVILPLIDELSTIRAIFRVEVLAPGADARYDIPFEDIDAVWLMPQIGGIPTIQVEGAEVHVDTFGLDGGVEYQEDVARDGRFQVGALATRLLANKFVKQEELAGWTLIKSHAAQLASTQKLQAFADDGTTQTPGSGKMNIFTLNEVITLADMIGIGGRRVTDIYLSPRRYGDLRQQVTQTALPFSLREKLWNNAKGDDSPADIRIHKVYHTYLVADNKGYAFTQKEGYFYGVMPIRQQIVTRDNPIAMLEHKIGIFGRERLGMAVIDNLGLIEITY